MSNGFKEMLDDAIKRNIVEIKQPIEMEIRKIFTEKIDSRDAEELKKIYKLLRDRLSDKDYEKVKEVADKFLNMDVIEDKGKE